MSLQIVTVKEIEKKRNRRYDTSVRHTSLFYSAIDLYAVTYYDSVYINLSLPLFLLSLVLATKTAEMYDYLYWVYQSIKSIDQFTVHGLNRIQIKDNRKCKRFVSSLN